ncbi:MAG: ATP-binding protein, partial [Firmicutes bacterium]|nr:ATP-binding protein [Bacillota bacterium]
EMEKAEIGLREMHKINISVDEMYSNVIEYSQASWARVSCEINEEDIIVHIEDNGIPYNPLDFKAPDVSKPLEEREIGGLGIFMARKLLDDLLYEYENSLNHVTMILHRKK